MIILRCRRRPCGGYETYARTQGRAVLGGRLEHHLCATGSGADGARAAEELRGTTPRGHSARATGINYAAWSISGPVKKEMLERCHVHGQGVDHPPKRTSGMAEQAEELRRAKECEGVHIDAWDWDQLRGVRHAVVVDNKTLALEKRCSALKSENDRIRRELQKLQKMRNDVRRRAAALPRPMVLHVNKPEHTHTTETIVKDGKTIVIPLSSGVEHHEHLEHHAHLDFADDSTQTDAAAFSSSPAKPDAHAHHRDEHAHQIVKSSKGGPLGHYMKKTKSFSGKIEAGAGRRSTKMVTTMIPRRMSMTTRRATTTSARTPVSTGAVRGARSTTGSTTTAMTTTRTTSARTRRVRALTAARTALTAARTALTAARAVRSTAARTKNTRRARAT